MELKQRRAQLLRGDLQGGGLKEGYPWLRRNTGSISGSPLHMNKEPGHRGFESCEFVFSLNSVLGHGVAD